MASSAAGDSGVVGARAGRKTKKGPKSKVNSLVDEVPTFIEEIIPSPDGGPPQTIKYAIGDILGKGAAATVFKGKNVATGELVAIKKIFKGGMRAEQLKIFLKSVETEFTLMRQLSHPNIVAMKGRVEDASSIYIILEYVNGGSLATYLGKYGTFSPDIAAAQVKQVLQGLEYLHERGIVHRDIKAANLLITKSGMVKLADFGVSAQLENAQKRYSVVGTPYWMAPEVISMTGHTVRSDIWSLGCTLLELLTGHPPYWDLDQMRAVFCIVQDERPPIPADITGDLYRFLHRCFVKDPEKRASATELLTHPYIINAKLPSANSGKLDAKDLKNNLKALHGLPAVDTPPQSLHGGLHPPAPSNTAPNSDKLASPRIVVSQPEHSTSKPDSGKLPQPSPRTSAERTPPTSGKVPPPSRTVEKGVVKSSSANDHDEHEPVRSIQRHDEKTALLGENEKYKPDHGDEGAPCTCIIL